MPTAGCRRAYGVAMAARVGGRNLAISWVVGIACAAVVGGLLWLALGAGQGVLFILERMIGGA